MTRELTKLQMIERSISKTYRKYLWAPFITAINRYDLIQPGDKIAVCISGGKDSMCMAKLFQQLERVTDIPFETVYLVMDPGYNERNRKKIEENLNTLGIPAQIFETNIFAVADIQETSPCYLCARMRRGHLYNKAKELGCNKIALGHHMDDVIVTTVMAMFWSSKLETIIPKSHSRNFEGMELIRPMYMVREEKIEAWANYNKLEFIQCACRLTENYTAGRESNKRAETKELIRELRITNPEIEQNIFNSLHNVQLETFPAYKKGGRIRSFLEDYDETE